jgi:uncharacterized membrane protein
MLALASTVAGVSWLSRRDAAAGVFRWLPVPLWCYALPMAARAMGGLPANHPAYATVTDGLFPVVLGLLLLQVDLRALRKVGPQALAAMAAGAVGIMLGGWLVFAVLRGPLGRDGWMGIGILTATWTGGSLNMVALRSVLQAPDAVFAPLIVVDAAVAYSWMAALIASKAAADRINRWLGAVEVPAPTIALAAAAPRSIGATALGLVLAAVATVACRRLAAALPSQVTSASGWTVLLVTTLALLASLTAPGRRVGRQCAPWASAGLLVVLAAMGARADVRALATAPVWLAAGFAWLLIHAAVMLAAGRLWRIPLSVLAAASQANVGGVISAPAVAAVHQPSLAPVGLLLALSGNAVGTYLGLAVATACRWLAP